MARAKPLVGVTGPETGSSGPRLCIALGLVLAGAKPIQLRPSFSLPASELDGIVISGGHDVQPVLYQSAAEVEGNYDAQRDRFEIKMIQQTLAASQPILGICRGAQLLNVSLGGNLIQDLQGVQKDTKRRRMILPLKTLALDKESKLARIMGTTSIKVNSLHNQSIDRVGVGLVVTTVDDRDVVQAVENPDEKFLIGVQWHPEFLLYQKSSRRLFKALVDATR